MAGLAAQVPKPRVKVHGLNLNTVNIADIRFLIARTNAFHLMESHALGDWTADTAGLGYGGGVILFSVMLGAIAIAYFQTTISRTALFWFAFVLTRPLGAVVGDFLDKPIRHGGLALNRYSASATLVLLILMCILIFQKNPAEQGH